MDIHSIIKHELLQAADVLDNFVQSKSCLDSVGEAAEMLANCFKNGGKAISCGNGGSHCDAMHFAEELTGRYRGDRKSLPAIAISDPSHISCVGNDYGFDYIFSRFIEGLGQQGDILFALSTSGNSPNVVNAAESAKRKGMQIIALTGNTGGKLASLADLEIRVPHEGFADRIQEVHIKIIHIIILLIEKQLS